MRIQLKGAPFDKPARLVDTFMGGRMSSKITEDLQLTLIVIVAALAFIFITPFGVHRFLEGDYLVAVSDLFIVLAAGASAVKAWKTGATRVAGLIISVVSSLGLIIVTFSRGIEGVFWIYPLIMFVFYLSSPRLALIQVSLVLAAFVVREFFLPHTIFYTQVQLISFLATAATATSFSYLFAGRNQRQRSQLMNWATKDPLTGLDNRRGLEKQIQLALSTKVDNNTDYGLLVMDLDSFKYINDTLGHSEGDRVLRDLAHLISISVRLSDHVFRYGGDEFVILLSNINSRGLEEVCKNVLNKIRSNLRCGETPVTVSIGAALLGSAKDAESWFLRADQCLYKAKEDGRNRFYIDTTEHI